MYFSNRLMKVASVVIGLSACTVWASDQSNLKPLEKKLFALIYQGDESGVKACIRKGVNVNAQDQDDNTPLMIAARMGLIKCMELLLNAGANTELTDFAGETALFDFVICLNISECYPSQKSHMTQALSLLLHAGAKTHDGYDKITDRFIPIKNSLNKTIFDYMLDISLDMRVDTGLLLIAHRPHEYALEKADLEKFARKCVKDGRINAAKELVKYRPGVPKGTALFACAETMAIEIDRITGLIDRAADQVDDACVRAFGQEAEFRIVVHSCMRRARIAARQRESVMHQQPV